MPMDNRWIVQITMANLVSIPFFWKKQANIVLVIMHDHIELYPRYYRMYIYIYIYPSMICFCYLGIPPIWHCWLHVPSYFHMTCPFIPMVFLFKFHETLVFSMVSLWVFLWFSYPETFPQALGNRHLWGSRRYVPCCTAPRSVSRTVLEEYFQVLV